MGIFHVTGSLAHPSRPRRRREVRFLVDTGAFYTMVPRDLLAELKVLPIREERVEFADGRKGRWKVGEARLTVDGRSVTTLVFFGPRGSQPLLGAFSLEGLALTVDPARRRLVPMPYVIMAAARAGSSAITAAGSRWW
ncbi:MAG: aspartyl protease family protein [Deltaproteobacteria bacterium]|nr:aspartyl protease family protein [Deltaproteobacteria bacterium]